MATVLKIIFLGFIPLTYFAILKNKNKGDPICTQQSVMNIHADSKNTFLTKQRNQNSRVPSTKQGAKQETSIAEQTFFLPAAFTVPSEAHPLCRAILSRASWCREEVSGSPGAQLALMWLRAVPRRVQLSGLVLLWPCNVIATVTWRGRFWDHQGWRRPPGSPGPKRTTRQSVLCWAQQHSEA